MGHSLVMPSILKEQEGSATKTVGMAQGNVRTYNACSGVADEL